MLDLTPGAHLGSLEEGDFSGRTRKVAVRVSVMLEETATYLPDTGVGRASGWEEELV